MVLEILCVEPIYPQYSGAHETCLALWYSFFEVLGSESVESFKEVAISLRHLGKSILAGNLYLGPLEIILRTLASGMTFILHVITCPAEGYK